MKGYKFRKNLEVGLIKDKPKEELRLIRWANDGYPPIDLHNEFNAVLDLIQEVKRLRKLLKAKDE